MSQTYTKKVLDHFSNPRNPGKIEDADVVATVGSASCGDMDKIYLKVDADTDVIEDIKFESFGCAANIASTSVATEMAKGKTLEEAKNIHFKDVLEELGGLPKHKVHCASLATSGLKAAIIKYEAKVGRRKTDQDFVKRMLTGVLDPVEGVNIVAAEKVESIEVDGKVVKITLSEGMGKDVLRGIKEDIKRVFSGLDLELEIT